MGKTKLVTSNLEQKVGGACVSLLLLMLLVLFCPTITNASSALNGSGYNKPAWQPSEPSAVSLSLEEIPEMEIVPRASGEVGVSSARLSVSTSSNAGYKLYVSTKDRTNAMVNVYDQSSASIAALSTPTAASGFKPNTWGYALTDSTVDSNTIYQPMPVASSLAYDTKALTGEHYLSFAASIDNSLPAGSYVNTVTISAIANPALITGMMELTYMQDMTSSICKDTIGRDGNTNQDASGSYIITPGSEPTKQLIDIRDGKEYWVAKLADGNCWMTQNLAYDLVKGKVLTPSDSDVSANWTVPTTRSTTIPNNEENLDENGTRSWGLGSYVLIAPNHSGSCDNLSAGHNVGECTWLQRIDDSWSPTFEIQDDLTWGDYHGYITVNAEHKTYDAHYLIGSYYQFNAAAAGTGANIISPETSQGDPSKLTNATSSICPKGWRLPTGGRYATVGNLPHPINNFYQLYLAYGYPDANSGEYGPYNSAISNLYGPNQNPLLAPMYFTLDGGIYLRSTDGNTMRGLTVQGSWRTRTAFYRNDFAYFLNISAVATALGHYSNRANGLSVRCLAK